MLKGINCDGADRAKVYKGQSDKNPLGRRPFATLMLGNWDFDHGGRDRYSNSSGCFQKSIHRGTDAEIHYVDRWQGREKSLSASLSSYGGQRRTKWFAFTCSTCAFTDARILQEVSKSSRIGPEAEQPDNTKSCLLAWLQFLHRENQQHSSSNLPSYQLTTNMLSSVGYLGYHSLHFSASQQCVSSNLSNLKA